jgi:hypothetical protein
MEAPLDLTVKRTRLFGRAPAALLVTGSLRLSGAGRIEEL